MRLFAYAKKKIRKENKAKNKIIPKHYKNLKGFAEHNFFCQWEHFNREEKKETTTTT